MKRKIFILATVLSLFAFSACKDENKVTILETPVASALGTLPSFADFTMDNSDNELIFSWSAANLGFQASASYELQFDLASNNFSDPTVLFSAIRLGDTITVGDFNDALINAGFTDFGIDHAMQFRLVTIVDAAETIILYSDPVDFTIATFATVFPPIYATGSALGGWDWGSGHDIELRSSEPSVYNTIAHFLNGESFRFFAQQDWNPKSYNFPWFATVDSDLANAVDGDSNFRVVGATGYYSITVNLSTKTIVMEPVEEPKMFITGGAVGGWDWSTNYVQMTWKSNGIFEATTDFVNGEAFRFFAQQDWNPTSYNYPYFADGEVSALFENAGDGDKNFRFMGTTGNYVITVNLLDLKVIMTATK
jgi:hypothetical protein